MNLNFDPTPAQTMALTACMLAISNVDGVHPAETALIQAFYESGRAADMPSFSEVQSSHMRAISMLQQIQPDADFSDALVKLCLIAGYADGELSHAERDTALGFARCIGVSPEQFDEHLQLVRDALLGSLAGLPDAESVAALAKEL